VYYKHEIKYQLLKNSKLELFGYVFMTHFFDSMKMFIHVVFIMYLIIQL